jgi:hypothetical protein
MPPAYLSRFRYCEHNVVTPHWIVLALHHAVADGISSMVIVRDLLATCSALIGVGKLPPELPHRSDARRGAAAGVAGSSAS